MSYNNVTAQKVLEVIDLNENKPIPRSSPMYPVERVRRRCAAQLARCIKDNNNQYVACPDDVFDALGHRLIMDCWKKKRFLFHKDNIPGRLQLYNWPEFYTEVFHP